MKSTFTWPSNDYPRSNQWHHFMSPLKLYNFYLKHFSQKRLVFQRNAWYGHADAPCILEVHSKYFRLGWNWLNITSKGIRKWFQPFWSNFEGVPKTGLRDPPPLQEKKKFLYNILELKARKETKSYNKEK